MEEFFDQDQKGSSAMPHKRNPVLSENLTGLARYIRSGVIPSMENIVLWHERDISHSSVERIMSPDIIIATDFSLMRLTNIINNLVIYPENMKKNINLLGGLHKSQNILLHLTQKGMSRQKAYSIVQKAAMRSWQSEEHFEDILKADNEINKYIKKNELKKLLLNSNKINHINWIFDKK